MSKRKPVKIKLSQASNRMWGWHVEYGLSWTQNYNLYRTKRGAIRAARNWIKSIGGRGIIVEE